MWRVLLLPWSQPLPVGCNCFLSGVSQVAQPVCCSSFCYWSCFLRSPHLQFTSLYAGFQEWGCWQESTIQDYGSWTWIKDRKCSIYSRNNACYGRPSCCLDLSCGWDNRYVLSFMLSGQALGKSHDHQGFYSYGRVLQFGISQLLLVKGVKQHSSSAEFREVWERGLLRGQAL